MSAYERRRGANFEREVSGYLSERLGRVVKRKLGQARDSGDDIQVGRFRIECKRRASIAAYAWLEQCIDACGSDIPVVIARADGQEPIAILRLDDLVPLIAGELGPGELREVETDEAEQE